MSNELKIKFITNPFDIASFSGDLVFENNDLNTEQGLETAVIISLFTDRRANDDDILPEVNSDDKRGWWADQTSNIEEDQIGSRLWLLNRAKTTEENIVRCKQFVRESLQWMIDDGVVIKMTVDVERQGDPGNDRLAFAVDLFKQDGSKVSLRFDNKWEGQFA